MSPCPRATLSPRGLRPRAPFHFCTGLRPICTFARFLHNSPLAAFSHAHFTGAINSSELSVTTMVTVPELPRSACKESVFTAMYGARGLMDW